MYLNIEKTYSDLIAADSRVAKEEKNDCVVRAISAVCNVSYVTAHRFCKEYFVRKDKRGTKNEAIVEAMNKFKKSTLSIDSKAFEVEELPIEKVKNMYRLHGQEIWREKTLKSFIQDNPKGDYLVLVSKHALVVKEGEVIDWKSFEYKPTRKVQSAYKLTDTRIGVQTELVFE